MKTCTMKKAKGIEQEYWEQEPLLLRSEVARAIRQTASRKATGPAKIIVRTRKPIAPSGPRKWAAAVTTVHNIQTVVGEQLLSGTLFGMPANRSAVFQSTIIHVVNYSYDEIAARTINRLLLHGDVFLTALGRSPVSVQEETLD